MACKPIITRLAAALAGIGVLLSMGACSSSPAKSSNASDTAVQTSAGSAALFMPADGITMSQQAPLNTWAKLTPSIISQLKKHGMKNGGIETFTSDSLDKQSLSVQDWVVTHTTDAQAASSDTTLIVAPVASSDTSSKQYGDYVTQPQSETDGKAETRLRSALQLAKKSGIHVVLIANTVQDFTPDVFVRCSTPEQIGELQANMLVSKLSLEKATSSNPKAIEVLIPHSPASSGDETGSSDEFAKEAFKGVWKVLKPYYAQGKAYSPSGTLTKDSSDDSWSKVAFDADTDGQAAQVIERRLPVKKTDEGTARTRIDGIIAMNDAVAADVTEQLATLGYSGSAADINPSITIPDILGNIVGNKDLKREAVPDPAQSSDDGSASQRANERNNRWPIVTGFGTYVDNLPQVVNGKQWMTGLENREILASDIAEVALRLNRSESLDGIEYISKGSIDGTKDEVPVIHEDLIAVSAANLKTALIDTGYVSMADAGL